MNVNADNHQLLRADLDGLLQVFTENKEYAKAINSFLYPLKDRLQLAENITKKLNNQEIWNNLFQILIKKHRFDIVTDVLSSLQRNLLAEEGKVKTELRLAYEHDEKVVGKIIRSVEKVLNSKIEVSIIIDPDIIGGFVAETDSKRIDGSIHNNLVKLVQTSSKRFRMRSE